MRQAYILTIRAGMEEGYEEIHKAVWPELIEEARRAGIRNHTVFRNGRTLFVYLESDNPDEATRRLKRSDVKMHWDELMSEFLEPESAPLKEVFHMD